MKKIAEDLPVVRIVDTLLKHAIIQDASDIHIEPMEDKLLIRYRIEEKQKRGQPPLIRFL